MLTKPREVTWSILFQSGALALVPLVVAIDWNQTKSSLGPGFINLLLLGYLTWKMSQGKNWARIVLLVFFVLGTPLAVFQIGAEFRRSPTLGALMVFQTALEGVALLLAFSAPAKEWFKKPAKAASA